MVACIADIMGSGFIPVDLLLLSRRLLQIILGRSPFLYSH